MVAGERRLACPDCSTSIIIISILVPLELRSPLASGSLPPIASKHRNPAMTPAFFTCGGDPSPRPTALMLFRYTPSQVGALCPLDGHSTARRYIHRICVRQSCYFFFFGFGNQRGQSRVPLACKVRQSHQMDVHIYSKDQPTTTTCLVAYLLCYSWRYSPLLEILTFRAICPSWAIVRRLQVWRIFPDSLVEQSVIPFFLSCGWRSSHRSSILRI